MAYARSRLSDRHAVRVVFDPVVEPSLAKQSMKAECDINVIMGRYMRSGQIDHFGKYAGEYGVASSLSFQESMNIVVKAEAMFADLPSAVRKRFGNSPAAFLEFVGDEANLPELRKMGLAAPLPEPEAPPAPIDVRVVPGPPDLENTVPT